MLSLAVVAALKNSYVMMIAVAVSFPLISDVSLWVVVGTYLVAIQDIIIQRPRKNVRRQQRQSTRTHSTMHLFMDEPLVAAAVKAVASKTVAGP